MARSSLAESFQGRGENPHQLREGIIEFARGRSYTHAITLNANQGDIGFDGVERLFKRFCYVVDRYAHQRLRVEKLLSHQRFEAIAFPEHLESNAHLHICAKLSSDFLGHDFDIKDQREIDRLWRETTGGSGSTLFREITDDGWMRYITKEHQRPDHQYILSSDFHSNDKMVSFASATTIGSASGKRKIASNSN